MGERLEGGVANAGAVTREGEIVLRPAPVNGLTIDRVLHHVVSRGFPAPEPLEARRDGRQAFRFIPGQVSFPPYPEGWVTADATLGEVGRLLRSYHNAVQGFDAGDEAEWSTELADPSGGDVICHNDVCIENVVFRDGRAVGLLDFDFAAPGRPVWDLAMTARFWVPLLDPRSAAATGRDGLDPFSRVRLLADAYGLDESSRPGFSEVLMEIEDVAVRFVLGRIEKQDAAFIRMWNALGGKTRHQRKMAWLDANLAHIDRALLD
jgi:Phosphotransferase enzyme family